jgi:exodeoxyribonuclease-3
MKKEFVQSFQSMAPDVLCLQETKAQDDQVIEALKDIQGYNLFVNSAVKKGYTGTAIISKKKTIKRYLRSRN